MSSSTFIGSMVIGVGGYCGARMGLFGKGELRLGDDEVFHHKSSGILYDTYYYGWPGYPKVYSDCIRPQVVVGGMITKHDVRTVVE